MKIFAFTVTRADTPARVALLNSTLWRGRESAGAPFDWHVWANDASNQALVTLQEADSKNVIQAVHKHDENLGQHFAWNEAYKIAEEAGYKYFLRIDDDCEFITKRWLKKLRTASEGRLDDKFVLAPVVRGLKNPPARSTLTTVNSVPLEFLVDAIGGICRFHPMKLLKIDGQSFVADVRKPLGSGDATGIASWCKSHTIPMAYCRHIRVRHNTRQQEATDPEHFLRHDLMQTVPYIPPFKVSLCQK